MHGRRHGKRENQPIWRAVRATDEHDSDGSLPPGRVGLGTRPAAGRLAAIRVNDGGAPGGAGLADPDGLSTGPA
ncbi:hypothetical protein DESC_720364 [Desulfosarcina cetonica]|nr:hypothetical protein DESC_720364 [Desulfosarcina cetonica]